MTSDEPITLWIDGLRQGDDAAAHRIWQHFVIRLCDAMRRKLRPDTRRVYDEEDAAVSAFRSLCVGVEAGRFPDLNDRDSLWRLLLVIASRKVTNRHRHDTQQRRDIRRNLDESVFQLPADSGCAHLEQFASREPTPEFEAEFMDTSLFLFEQLDEPTLREIAQLKVEGYSDSEIGNRVGCSRQAVRRRTERVRRIWARNMGRPQDSEEKNRTEATKSGIEE